MAYNINVANRIREYLSSFPDLNVEEKKMFKGLAFLINGKMCINVSGENLMCRFDPDLTNELEQKEGYMPMIMRGKMYQGYCFVEPSGFSEKADFDFWMKQCLNFNDKAKSSKNKS